MKITKFVLVCMVSVTALLLQSQFSFAADARVAVINTNKVLMTSKAGENAREKLEAAFKPIRLALEKDQETLRNMEEEANKKKAAWSEKTLKEKSLAYKKEAESFIAKQASAKKEDTRLKKKYLEPIYKKIQEITAEIAEDEKFDVVIPSAGTIYASESVDITDKVIAKLNKVMK